MPHPLLSLAAWGFILFRTVTALRWGWVWTGWRIAHREDHSISYWAHVLAGVVIVVVFPFYCLPDWIDLFHNYDKTFALFLQGRQVASPRG